MHNFRTVSCCLAFTRNLPQASRLRSLRILPIPQTQPVLPPTLCTSSSCRSLTLADLLPESPPHVPPRISSTVCPSAIMRPKTLSVTVPLLFSTLTSALTLDCTHIRVDKKKFNFEKLGGPHSITIIDKDRPPAIHNTTYTIDICHQLDKVDRPKAEQCPRGTYGMKESWAGRINRCTDHVCVQCVV